MIVHLGVVVIAVAFAASASNVRQNEFILSPGDTATFAGHELTYVRMNEVVDSNKVQTQALVLVDGSGPYSPGISKYTFGSSVVGTPSVKSTFRTDVALSLLEVPDGPDKPVTIRVTIQPLIMWLWIGGAIMAAGTLLAAFPRGRRRGTEPVSAPIGERVRRPSEVS
jgi:cytochrome c-type biogenesis protein CcmF